MPTFEYNTAAGNATIDAPDRSAALRQLIARGVAPSGIQEVRGRAAHRAADQAVAGASGPIKVETPREAAPVNAGGLFGGRSNVTLPETAAFIRELATALSAGLPLMSALQTPARTGRTGGQKAMLLHLIANVEQGSSLADACKSWGKPFDGLLVNLVKAGEVSGKLPDVLQQGADLVEKRMAMGRSIVSATIYTGMVAGVLVFIKI